MSNRSFRFAASFLGTGTAAEWRDKCRRAEDLGYDAITVPDFLGGPSPFLALAAAAEVTTRPRLGTYVINTGLYRPSVLARDIAAADWLTDGRLEAGIGAGYLEADFQSAGLAFPTARARTEHLEQTAIELRRLLAKPVPPLLIGGNSPGVLRVAARHADIVSTTGSEARTARTRPRALDYATLAGRAELVRSEAGERIDELELNLLVHLVYLTDERDGGLAFLQKQADHLSAEDLVKLPTLLSGTPQAIADELVGHRETLGFSYFTVLEPMMENFAQVMEKLR
jgi:probable F420-dependent oxidoreductase